MHALIAEPHKARAPYHMVLHDSCTALACYHKVIWRARLFLHVAPALQRGDAEMAQKLWRVVRACVELGPKNPIQQIHDQGAGGNCNVVRPCFGLQLAVRAVHVSRPLPSLAQCLCWNSPA